MQITQPSYQDRKLRLAHPWTGRARRLVIGVALFCGLLAGTLRAECGEAGVFTEYQVKALYLLNFTKYVDWPAEAFAGADAPITIGVLGENHFGDDLKTAVEGKTVNGRAIVVQAFNKDSDWGKCHVLFISGSEKKRLGEILGKVKTLPVLTVGESDQFTQQGGIINFVKRDGKIRLEIDLNAARQAKLQISSKLLSVADTVRGKQ
jgi:hypothetical protein